MMTEMCRLESDDEVYTEIAIAKRDYDDALARFNSAQDENMINLAVFDMKAAMKRYCFIIEKVKNRPLPDIESKPLRKGLLGLFIG